MQCFNGICDPISENWPFGHKWKCSGEVFQKIHQIKKWVFCMNTATSFTFFGGSASILRITRFVFLGGKVAAMVAKKSSDSTACCCVEFSSRRWVVPSTWRHSSLWGAYWLLFWWRQRKRVRRWRFVVRALWLYDCTFHIFRNGRFDCRDAFHVVLCLRHCLMGWKWVNTKCSG